MDNRNKCSISTATEIETSNTSLGN
jgi:hypothetical protein